MWRNFYAGEFFNLHIFRALTHSPDQIQFVSISGFAVFVVIALILPVIRLRNFYSLVFELMKKSECSHNMAQVCVK